MPNGLVVSFGDIVALAGDFYGDPSAPISQAKNADTRRYRFYNAYFEDYWFDVLFGFWISDPKLNFDLN